MEVLGDFTTSVEKALTEIDRRWRKYGGLIICGSHTPRSPETLIEIIKNIRESEMPFLGICYGYQLAAVEYARNVLGIENATSEEWGKGTYVVKRRLGLKVGLHEGETYWNNYEVDLNWTPPKNYFVSQYHPEYQSSSRKPHKLLIKFINYCRTYDRKGI